MKKLYFIPILLIIKFSSAQSNQWSKLGTNFNGRIIAVTADKTGNIYAAGEFTNLAGKQYVAKWNGTNWSELGTGIDTLNAIGPISNLCFDVSGNLYAAMSLMDSAYRMNVYKWNGTYWSKLGNGINILRTFSYYSSQIYSLNSDKAGNIYVAGRFADSLGYYYVAKWNGTTWAELGTDTNALNANGDIYAVVSDSTGNIYAAGEFTNLAGERYVAKWNGTTWAELGTGSSALKGNYGIVSMCIDDIGNLYARGYIENSSNKYYVAKWNGTTWSQLGTDLGTSSGSYTPPGQEKILAIDNQNNLYTRVYDILKKYYVYKWDGTLWNEIYKPLDTISYIWNVSTDINGNIYTSIDSEGYYFILKWTNPTPAVNATNLYFTNTDSASFSVGFTKGNGKKRLVVCGLAPLTNLPIDSVVYAASSIFKLGHQLDSNSWVVYNDTGAFVTITGLNSCTKYFISVFEYNDDSTRTWYLKYKYLQGFDSTQFHQTLKIISSSGDSIFCSYINFYLKGNNYNDVTYQWYKNGNAINTANNFTDSNIISSGIYSLKINKNNCSLSSNNLAITINAKPISGFTINTLSQCLNENNYLFADTTSTTLNRVWNLGDNSTNTNDTFSKTYSNAGTYNVKLKVTDAHNCVDSISKIITVKPNPAKPIVTALTKSLLQSSVANSYQWYFNNSIITNATNQTLIITQKGNYSVKIDSTNGCDNLSNTLVVSSLVGVNEITKDNEIKIYPNPATDELFILFSSFQNVNDVWVELIDLKGSKLMCLKEKTNNIIKLNISHIDAGMYFVLINNKAYKFIKSNQ